MVGASPDEAEHQFWVALREVTSRMARAYPPGLLRKLNDDEARRIDAAERRADAAARAGSYDVAGEALKEFERAWVDAIRAHRGVAGHEDWQIDGVMRLMITRGDRPIDDIETARR